MGRLTWTALVLILGMLMYEAVSAQDGTFLLQNLNTGKQGGSKKIGWGRPVTVKTTTLPPLTTCSEEDHNIWCVPAIPLEEFKYTTEDVTLKEARTCATPPSAANEEEEPAPRRAAASTKTPLKSRPKSAPLRVPSFHI